MLSRNTAVYLSPNRLLALERSGRYEEALASFGDDWQEDDFLPDQDTALNQNYPEVLLRFGSLVGFYGYKHAVPNAQERSKNILTFARERFLELGDLEKIVECETYIALSYWRSGEYREARVWIEEALAKQISSSSPTRLYAEVVRSMILLGTGEIEENLERCAAIEHTMRKYGDAFLNGSFCTNLALSFKRLSKTSEAMRYLSLAKYFHEKSRHKPYLGTVHNNLAQLYKVEKKFKSAHESADAAIRLYKKLKDRTREGSTWDTKAQIYLAEQKFPEALAMANRAIKLLQDNPASADLSESLLTKAKVLALSGSFGDGVLSLVDAVNITRVQNGDSAAKCLIEDFEKALANSGVNGTTSTVESDELELIVPASLSHYTDYKGVWITNDKLRNAGLPSGSLAIITPGEVARGDLVAVLEAKNTVVSCGFYDSEFGIVCIESDDDEPELFTESEITILGKIVGVCRAGKEQNGKKIVEALPI